MKYNKTNSYRRNRPRGIFLQPSGTISTIGVARGEPQGPSPPQRMRKNIKASLVNLALNMRYKNDKNIKFVITRFVFSSSKCTKIRFRTELRLGPTGGAYDAPPDPLVGWGGGYPLPIPLHARRLQRLELGVSVLRPPQHKILATPVISTNNLSAITLFMMLLDVAVSSPTVVTHRMGAHPASVYTVAQKNFAPFFCTP